MRKRPSLWRNNGSIVIRVRIDGEDKRIYRLGRWDDPVAVARAQAIAAEIWSDIQRGELDDSLSRYRPKWRNRQNHVISLHLVFPRFGWLIRGANECVPF